MVLLSPSLPSQQPSQQSSQQSSQQPPTPQLQAPQGYQSATRIDDHYAAASNASGHMQHAHKIANSAMTLALPTLPGQKTSMSILEALSPTNDPKEKMKKQRAIAKTCVDSIQKVDGYRYSFHNCWNSREDDSFRFSYYCNDSLLNKDRAANGKGAKYGKRATKPVYDCRGVLSVKFSAVKQTLDVFYKHIPIHKTYEERAPPPRKDSKRRRFMEVHNPEALARIIHKTRKEKPPPDSDAPPKPKRQRQKDKEAQKQTASNSIESDLRAQSLRSLLELIQTDTVPDVIPEEPQNEEQYPQQSRRRPRVSCDTCKVKKTKCDGLRPTCKTCSEKSRQCIYSEHGPEEIRQVIPDTSQPAPRRESVHVPREENVVMTELEKLRAELAEAKSRIGQLEAEKTRSGSETNTPTRATQNEQTAQSQPSQQQMPLQQYQTPHGYSPTHTSYTPVNRSVHAQSAPHPTHTPANHQLHTPASAIAAGTDSNDPYGRDLRWAPFYPFQGAMPRPPQPQQQDPWNGGQASGAYR